MPLPSGKLVRFVRQAAPTDPRAQKSGTFAGRLVVADGCLRLSMANDEQPLPLWPQNYNVRAVETGLELLDGSGRVVARVGDFVRVRALGLYSPPAPAEVSDCPAPYLIVADVLEAR